MCPYCNVVVPTTKDHILPRVLGGEAKVIVCRSCNSLFGHTFEVHSIQDISPLIVALALNGLSTRANVMWKRAFKDPISGLEYDLDSKLRPYLSKPVIDNDDRGRFKRGLF